MTLAGVSSQGSSPVGDGILGGANDLITRAIVLLTGQNLLRGTVLGKVAANKGAATVGAPAFTGTGNGVLTRADPAYAVGVQEGTYNVRLIEAAANAGNFQVIRPDGTVDGIAAVGVAYDGQIKFTIADGSTDFSNAANFTLAVTIADTSAGKYVQSLAAATDGSQVPCAILGEDCDATATDKNTVGHMAGTFDENALIYGTGHTASSVREALRDSGINLQSSLAR